MKKLFAIAALIGSMGFMTSAQAGGDYQHGSNQMGYHQGPVNVVTLQAVPPRGYHQVQQHHVRPVNVVTLTAVKPAKKHYKKPVAKKKVVVKTVIVKKIIVVEKPVVVSRPYRPHHQHGGYSYRQAPGTVRDTVQNAVAVYEAPARW